MLLDLTFCMKNHVCVREWPSPKARFFENMHYQIFMLNYCVVFNDQMVVKGFK